MVDPTPFRRPRNTIFGAGPDHTRSERGGIRPEFHDALAAKFFGSSLFAKDFDPDSEEVRRIQSSIENALEFYADDQVYALVPGFKTDEENLQELVRDIIEDIQKLCTLGICTSAPSEEELNTILKQCLKDASIEVCGTNIFNPPSPIPTLKR